MSAHLSDDVLHDANLLLSYAARTGLEVSDDKIVAIIAAQDHATLTQDIELRFWEAFGALARLAKPVSVDSLRAALRPASIPPGRFSRAETAVRQYRRWAYVTLALLVILQMYTLIGLDSVTDLDAVTTELPAITDELWNKRTILEEKKHQSADTSKVPPGPSTYGQDFEVSKLVTRMQEKSVRLETSERILKWWQLPWHPFRATQELSTLIHSTFVAPANAADMIGVSATQALTAGTEVKYRPYAAGDIEQVRREAKFALKALQTYALPFMYGLLGACIFILRNLASDVESLTYREDITYQLRLPLGALSGVAIVGIINGVSEAEAINRIAPLPLAFLAGYSVEVLFSAIDRIIGAFTTRS